MKLNSCVCGPSGFLWPILTGTRWHQWTSVKVKNLVTLLILFDISGKPNSTDRKACTLFADGLANNLYYGKFASLIFYRNLSDFLYILADLINLAGMAYFIYGTDIFYTNPWHYISVIFTEEQFRTDSMVYVFPKETH